MFTRRSATWTAIILFIVIVALQASSYFKIAFSIKDDPIVPGDPLSKKPLPSPSPSSPAENNTVHVQTYKRDYTTIWSYSASLIFIYALFCIVQQQWCRLQKKFMSDRGMYCRIRSLLGYEFSILDSTWTFSDVIQVSGLVLLNSLFILRHRVLVQELEGGRDLYHQEYANRAAQLALVNMSAGVALSVRNILHNPRFGTHTTLAWHAWFGRLGGLCALYHTCFQFVQKYYRNSYDGVFQVLFFNVRYTTGTCMITAVFVLYVGSHPLVRTMSYRFFRVSHMLAFLTLVLLGGFHHWTFVVFYVAVTCIWLMDQFKLSWPARLVSVKALPGNIVKLQLEPSFSIEPTTFIPGQFAFVTITDGWLSQKLYSHPFSVSRFDQEPASSLPSSTDGPLLNDKSGKTVYTFYIKTNGKHTASLYQIAESGDSTCLRHMRISKPLGKPTMDMAGRSYSDFEVVVLVAEGIGITPWISVLQQLGQRGHHIKTKRITLIWSIRSADTLESFLPEFQSHLTDIDCIIKVYLTRDNIPPPDLESSVSDLQLSKGRPNYTTLLKEIQCKYPTTDIALGICAHDETIQQCGNTARGFSNNQSIWAIRPERFEF